MNPEWIFVSPVLPWPADQGSKRFVLEAARALRQLGPVRWVTRAIGPQEQARERLSAEGFELHLDESFVPQDPLHRLRRRARIDWRAWRRAVPREVEFVSSPGVLDRVARLCAAHPESYVVGAYWTTSRALESAAPGRRILLLADVDTIAARAAAASGAPVRSAREVDRLARAEVAAFGRADLLLCLTPEDERSAAALWNERASTQGVRPQIGRWPATIEVGYRPPPLRSSADGTLRLLCFGHWDAPFNRDGLRWFLRDIWPQLRQEHHGLELRLVGRGLDAVAEASAEGVEALGFVEDLSAQLAAADVVVVPLRWAGGLRYRLLESLAAARPVLCTSVAAAGSGAQAELHHLEANTAEEFVRALDILRDPSRRAALGAAGHAWVRDHYGRSSLGPRLRAALGSLIDFA